MSRTDRLVELLQARELDSLLVTDLLNVRYLTGFTGTNGAAIVTPEERLFFTDFRYVEQAGQQVREYERVEAGRDMLGDVARRLRGRAGFDDEHLSVAAHRKLSETLPEGVELVPAGGLVEELRAVKDASEVASMRAAAELATRGLRVAARARACGAHGARRGAPAGALHGGLGRGGAVVPADRGRR